MSHFSPPPYLSKCFLGSAFFIFMLSSGSNLLFAQDHPAFTQQDSIRGSITPERAWWDLKYYDLSVKVNPADCTFTGSNMVQYSVLSPYQTMQIDLQPPMAITKVLYDEQQLDFLKNGDAYYIKIIETQTEGQVNQLTIYFEGKPKVSTRPPWEGGITWAKDKNGNDFIANSNQGDGASVWWPCKDHPYDEPDSMQISVTVPKHLTDVSNGRLREIIENPDETRTFVWFVSNPINNYGVNISIGDYAHFSEQHEGELGLLDCDYYVLSYNLKKAKKQFQQVPKMLDAFEHWFGPYPFYADGYKLIEVPYLGMEHQSAVTYGNEYQNGYRGTDLSSTGWGLKFDFIIIHESGHEWFANSITYSDVADMWIHEGFTAYSENLYLDYHFGKQASSEYVRGTRLNILNDRPVIGHYDVNNRGSGDMYSKGANILHTLRQIIDDDEKWRSILRGLNKEFYHQTVSTREIENYISRTSGLKLSSFFDQYLRTTQIPAFEYGIIDSQLIFRWSNCLDEFNMPIKVWIDGEPAWLSPTVDWSIHRLPENFNQFRVDPDFYITNFELIRK